MKLKSILLFTSLAFVSQANAQVWVADSVEMGVGYVTDNYYSLKNGNKKAENNTNWHIAVQMTPPGPYANASVLANHAQGKVSVYPLHLSASASFDNLTDADTVGAYANPLFNSDTSWNYGAFNMMASGIGNYGWGDYDQTDHNVYGDSMFLVTINNTDVYKVWIQEYTGFPADSVKWQIRLAKFDGTDDRVVKIYRKPDYTDRQFVYYDIINDEVKDREPNRSAWDIAFTRYKEYTPGAPGGPWYNVTGVLSSFNAKVAEAAEVVPDDADLQDYIDGNSFAQTMNAIGSNWKSFNGASYDMEDSLSYFIKTTNTHEYYQLMFTRFDFSAGGSMSKVVFAKKSLGTTNVKSVNTPVSAYHIAPNPAINEANILVDTKEQVNGAKLTVTDIAGKVVSSGTVNIKAGLNTMRVNTAGLASGTYIVTLTNGTWKLADKLVVQH